MKKYLYRLSLAFAAVLGTCLLLKPFPFHWGATEVFVPGIESEAQSAIARFKEKKYPFSIERSAHQRPDGGSVSMLYLRHQQPKGLLVYFQGGGSSSYGMIDGLASTFIEIPVDILIYDYRGTGLTGGRADASKLVGDAEYLIGVAKKQLPAGLPIVYYGVSMGTLFSGELARSVRPDGLVFDGAVTTVQELIRGQAPWYVRHFLSIHAEFGLSNFSNIAEHGWENLPVLLLVGENDSLTPVKFSRAIVHANVYKDCSAVRVIAGARHAESLTNPTGRKELIQFMRGIIKGQKCVALTPVAEAQKARNADSSNVHGGMFHLHQKAQIRLKLIYADSTVHSLTDRNYRKIMRKRFIQ